jgi:hypothetical protein
MQKSIIVVLAFLWVGACNVARAAPAEVFRVDDRDPSVIFQAGFRPWGSNTNLVEHLEGSTCNNVENPAAAGVQGSIYVSTSDDRQVAMNVVRVRLRQMVRANVPPVVWMYTIRATSNVYSVARTFEAGNQNLAAGRYQTTYRQALVLREWVVRGPVPRDMIVGAQRYELINDIPVAVNGGYQANPNYVPIRTEANTAPLPPTTLTDQQTTMGRMRAVIADGARMAISACWCNTRVGDSSSAKVASTGATAAPSPCVKEINRVWPVTPTVRYVPGRGFWRADL